MVRRIGSSLLQNPFSVLSVKLWECADISYSEQLQMVFITAQESKEVCILYM